MKNLIMLKQVHGNHVEFIKDGDKVPELFQLEGDGIISRRRDLILASYASDCVMIAFLEHSQIGICHAGWKGLVSGIIENMKYHFTFPNCYIAPFLHNMEITKNDECHNVLRKKFGDHYFSEYGEHKLIFHFKKAVEEILSPFHCVFDPRSTIEHSELGSYRRTGQKGDGTQNRLAVYYNQTDHPEIKFFLPGEELSF